MPDFYSLWLKKYSSFLYSNPTQNSKSDRTSPPGRRSLLFSFSNYFYQQLVFIQQSNIIKNIYLYKKMPERALTQFFPGATQDATQIIIPKADMVEPTAINKFTPAATNTFESMLAGQLQVLAVKAPERNFGDDVTNNMQVVANDPTVQNDGTNFYSQTSFTVTFERILSAEELAAIALKPDAM